MSDIGIIDYYAHYAMASKQMIKDVYFSLFKYGKSKRILKNGISLNLLNALYSNVYDLLTSHSAVREQGFKGRCFL